jgi:hypothetical protein
VPFSSFLRDCKDDEHRQEMMGRGLVLAREGKWAGLALHLRQLTEGDRLRLALRISIQSGDHNAVEYLAVEVDKLARAKAEPAA